MAGSADASTVLKATRHLSIRFCREPAMLLQSCMKKSREYGLSCDSERQAFEACVQERGPSVLAVLSDTASKRCYPESTALMRCVREFGADMCKAEEKQPSRAYWLTVGDALLTGEFLLFCNSLQLIPSKPLGKSWPYLFPNISRFPSTNTRFRRAQPNNQMCMHLSAPESMHIRAPIC
eukprot:TRINITY_DN13252_c0_g1_i1.p1 TRINITY_DN13252_c0_g1~~TRINITY_DN13252_c0_g1_i1.p1  ORF type:complete len:179 (+),score=13.48 TRINITY_DN13252_c0_g1_i1:26-562(+)